MTAGQAIEMLDMLRPDNEFRDELKQEWLRQCDARIRAEVAGASECGEGADICWLDGLEYDAPLLLPEAYSAAYPHWLCAQVDLALGETARATNEMQLFNDLVQSFAVWMKRRHRPAGGKQFRW